LDPLVAASNEALMRSQWFDIAFPIAALPFLRYAAPLP
jgi:hypothetical protein